MKLNRNNYAYSEYPAVNSALMLGTKLTGKRLFHFQYFLCKIYNDKVSHALINAVKTKWNTICSFFRPCERRLSFRFQGRA